MALLFFLLLNSAFAGVLKDEVLVTTRQRFAWASVCQKLVSHESPLIDAASGTELDCMGKKVSVSEFCEKELAQDPYYLRAFVEEATKEVVCLSGKRVVFKYQCVRRSDEELCGPKPQEACQQLKLKLARRLDLVHSSHTRSEKGVKELNCYFESLPLKESLGQL
jgi:hypothetical protein